MKFIILIALAILAVAEAKKINFCYYPDYASNVVKPANIKAEYCTHIGYSFFNLNPDGTCTIKEPGWEGGIIAELVKKKSSNTKICPVIGGYGRSWMFGGVASNAAARQNFVKTCGALIQKYGFDNCFDVDWEFPAANEKEAFISLLKDIKAGWKGVELFAAVSAGAWQADISYNVKDLAATVDYINLMTYDYHGSWESSTGMNSALSGPAGDTLNIQATVNYFISKGAPANKLVVGVAFYGRTFGLTTSNSAPGAPSSGGDVLEYYKICADKSWVIKRDTTYQVPYGVKGSTWLSFDDPTSIAAKTKFVNDKGLAGALIWSIQQDDTTGACGGGAWPLLTAVYNGLNGGSSSGGSNNSPAPATTAAPVTTSRPNSSPTPAPSTGGVFRCPSADGYYVDPDCHYYHYCMNGNDMGKQACNNGLVFNSASPTSFWCDWTSPLCH